MANWAKETENFTILRNSLEAKFEDLDSYLTPGNKFFVCTSGDPVSVNPETYRMKIKGDAVEKTVTLKLDDLKNLPQHTVNAYVECAGNQRTLFNKIDQLSLERDSVGEDTMWTLGGISMGQWTGPRLSDVLALAGLKETAKWVAPMGLDVLNPECDIEIPMPIEKAMDNDTLVGLKLNGEELPVDNGYPVRMIVPGWIGTYWVKWVGWITVSANEIRNYRTDEYYVMDGKTVTKQNIKSSLNLPWPATLSSGKQTLTGIARSPDAPISKVEWSVNDGDWHPAEIISDNEKWGWTRFTFRWDATAGSHVIKTRAVDEAGNTQPEKAYHNPSTLLYNGVIPHPVTVV